MILSRFRIALRLGWLLLALISLPVLAPQKCVGQIGNKFPTVPVQMLSGRKVMLPDEFMGSFALVGIGTSKKAEKDLRTWQTPVYNKFIAKTGLMDDMFEVKVAFVPLFTGTSQLAKNEVVEKLTLENESLIFDHLYIYSGSKEPFLEIGIEERSEPYFLLLDKYGKVKWLRKGAFEEKYLEEIEKILTE